MKLKDKSKDKVLLYLPLIVIELYLLTSVLLYEFGPIQWPTKKKGLLYLLLIAYHVAFILGYWFVMGKNDVYGIKAKARKVIKFIRKKVNELFISKITDERSKKISGSNILKKYITIALCIYIIFSLLKIVRVVGSFNPIDNIEFIIKSILNPAASYSNKFTLDQGALIGGRYITMLITLFSFIYWPVIPICVYKIESISVYNKILFFIAIISEVTSSLVIGTNKGLFDVAIIIISVLAIKLSLNYKSGKFILDKKKKIIISIIAVLFSTIIMYFLFSTLDRVGGIDRYKLGYNGVPVNIDKGLLGKLPVGIKSLLIMVAIYLTQGYYGMSLSLTVPFTSSYGLGNNNFILSNVEELFNVSLRSNMYQYKIQHLGWHPTVNWHTFYTWIANDVSFWGVILVMLILGILFALVWRDVVKKQNIFAICLVPLYTILFIFLPCNNQIFSLPTTFMPFVFLTVCWIISNLKGEQTEYEGSK